MPKTLILIAGTTASGKSSLALALAQKLDATIVNADALQVYAKWQVLSARPSAEDVLKAPHALYGYVEETRDYSVGHWLSDLKPLLAEPRKNLIIVGGTGLYFKALLTGLSQIPPIPPEIRHAGNAHRARSKGAWFLKQLSEKNHAILSKIDINNPARLQRAWEVLAATGHGLDYWHSQPTRPALDIANTLPLLLNSPASDTNRRIDQRFDLMMQTGARAECEAALAAGFTPGLPANKAIGAREIIAAIKGEISFDEAADKAKILTHQYAKRQRTWFKSQMKTWRHLPVDGSKSPADMAADILHHTP